MTSSSGRHASARNSVRTAVLAALVGVLAMVSLAGSAATAYGVADPDLLGSVPDQTAVRHLVVSDTATAAADPTALPAHSGHGRRVVYSRVRQRVWVVGRAGRAQRTYLVSGQLGQPAPGSYRVYSRSRWAVSSVGAEVMQYMVRFAHGRYTGSPIGFHSIPTHLGRPAQHVSRLGEPISHGCVRQRMRDAAFLWRFAHTGTRVVVLR